MPANGSPEVMLTVNAKFIASELVPGLCSGEYEVEEGSTIRGLLAICEKQSGSVVPEKNFKYMYPLFNGRPVSLDSEINQSGTLHLCRVVSGG